MAPALEVNGLTASYHFASPPGATVALAGVGALVVVFAIHRLINKTSSHSILGS